MCGTGPCANRQIVKKVLPSNEMIETSAIFTPSSKATAYAMQNGPVAPPIRTFRHSALRPCRRGQHGAVIDAFVESLDLGKLGFKRMPCCMDASAYDPAVLLKIYFYGYLNRVRSSRRLEAECQLPFPG